VNPKLTEAEFYRAIHTYVEKYPEATEYELMELKHDREWHHKQNKEFAIRAEDCRKAGEVQEREQLELAIQTNHDTIERIDHKIIYTEVLLERRDTFTLSKNLPDLIPRTCTAEWARNLYQALAVRLEQINYHTSPNLANAVIAYRRAVMDDESHRRSFEGLLVLKKDKHIIEAAQIIGLQLDKERKTAKLNLWCELLASKRWKYTHYEIVEALPRLSENWKERLRKAYNDAWL